MGIFSPARWAARRRLGSGCEPCSPPRRRRATLGWMKALFLGNVAADTARGITAELPSRLHVEILADPQQLMQSPAAAVDADILTTNHWRPEYPPAPNVRLVQSVATGIELIDLAALPRAVVVCNAFGHETAIAEYVLMTMLVLSHRFREIEGEFRTISSWRPSWVQSGAPHGEILGTTVGIVGLGRVGREVARRAAAFGCRVVAVNRSRRLPDSGIERVYPLSELDQILPVCDFVVLCTALATETEGLIDSRRLALMKRSAFLINISRGSSSMRTPFTPRCATEGLAERRWMCGGNT